MIIIIIIPFIDRIVIHDIFLLDPKYYPEYKLSYTGDNVASSTAASVDICLNG